MNIEIDNKELREKTNTEEEIETYRLSISKVAGQALAAVVDRVNDNFQGGKVSRSQVANWALIQFSDGLTPDSIREIRAAHIDEFAAIDMVLRRAKESGKLPPELKAYLQKQIGADEIPKKKAKKSLQENNINDVI